jgi:hypothetical protein
MASPHAGRDLARVVPAHAVGDGKERERGIGQMGVLVRRANLADVLDGLEGDPEIEPGDDLSHGLSD